MAEGKRCVGKAFFMLKFLISCLKYYGYDQSPAVEGGERGGGATALGPRSHEMVGRGASGC